MAEELKKEEKIIQDNELSKVNGGNDDDIPERPHCPKCGHLVTAWTTIEGCHKHHTYWQCDHCYHRWPTYWD